MLKLEGECYSIVELKSSWEKKTCIHVELGNFIFFPIWFRIVLYINRLFVINEKYNSSFNYLFLHFLTRNKVGLKTLQTNTCICMHMHTKP